MDTQSPPRSMVGGRAPSAAGTPKPQIAQLGEQAPVVPSWTPDQMMSKATHDGDVATGLASADSTLADKTTNLNYAKGQLATQYKAAASAAADAMAARGIFRSSISDGTQNDLTAQKAIQQQFLDDQLTNAQTAADTAKTTINNANADWLKAFNASATDANAGTRPAATQVVVPPGVQVGGVFLPPDGATPAQVLLADGTTRPATAADLNAAGSAAPAKPAVKKASSTPVVTSSGPEKTTSTPQSTKQTPAAKKGALAVAKGYTGKH